MTTEQIKVGFEDAQGGRLVRVTFTGPAPLNQIVVMFTDTANPDETNAAERARVIAEAKRRLVMTGAG